MKFSFSHLFLSFILISFISINKIKGQNKSTNITSFSEIEKTQFQIPFAKKNANSNKEIALTDINLSTNEILTFDFTINKSVENNNECRSCAASAGFIIDGCHFIVENNKKDLRIYVGYKKKEKLPYYVIHRFAENITLNVFIKKHLNNFEWVVQAPYKTIGSTIDFELNAEPDNKITYTPVKGNLLSYSIVNSKIIQGKLPNYSSASLHPLFKYKNTAISKYDWDEPASKYLTLEKTNGKLTTNEIEGLKNYLIEYQLPTHNYMNYYFRKRMNSYMMEWVFDKTGDTKLVDKSIQVAQRAIDYRNDNFGQYKISYNRGIAPLWPNYKEVEVYEDGSIGLVPGASTFAGLPSITVPIRIIANNPKLWKQKYEGRSYYEIAMELIDEALKTIDYTYEIFVGDDNLIRYPHTLLRKEWHGKVYIYNRVFPVISGSIPLIEALEKFQIKAEKIKQIDNVNQSMINYLKNDMVFYGTNNVQYIKYPYSQAAQDKNPDKDHVEDFMHGSFDSRDFQLFYISKRYGFEEKYVQAMANTLVDKVAKENGKFSGRMDGSAKAKYFKTPIAYDGFIWYAKYNPKILDIIVNLIIDKDIAVQNNIWDAYCLYEILKLKESITSEKE